MIEDNPADVSLLRYALDRHGEAYELEALGDGEQALQFVHEHRAGKRDPEPCVIILDLHLPKYDGLEVLRAIKQEPSLAHIAIVVLTSLTSSREEQEMLALGVRLYRSKPTRLEEIIAVAGRILEICKDHRIRWMLSEQ